MACWLRIKVPYQAGPCFWSILYGFKESCSLLGSFHVFPKCREMQPKQWSGSEDSGIWGNQGGQTSSSYYIPWWACRIWTASVWETTGWCVHSHCFFQLHCEPHVKVTASSGIVSACLGWPCVFAHCGLGWDSIIQLKVDLKDNSVKEESIRKMPRTLTVRKIWVKELSTIRQWANCRENSRI